MLKVIRFIVLLPLKIAALPIILALIAATWIAVFFTSMSAWFFNLLAFLLFAYSVIGDCMGDLHGAEFRKSLIASFVVFMVPNIAEWFIFRLVESLTFS